MLWSVKLDRHLAPVKGKGKKHAAMVENLAAQRAVNTKDYLVKEKGIDASRIYRPHRHPERGRSGELPGTRLAPPSTADVSGTTAVDESSVKPQTRTPLGAKKAAHHKKAAAAPAQ